MAEQKREKLHIRLHVYDEEIDVTIDRDDEAYYRAAAKLITDRYNAYAQAYRGRKSDHTIALMTLIDIALLYEKERDNVTITTRLPMIIFSPVSLPTLKAHSESGAENINHYILFYGIIKHHSRCSCPDYRRRMWLSYFPLCIEGKI